VGVIHNNPHLFPFNYNQNPTFCGIVCNQNAPPFSPIRRGAQNNIYVIPAPNIFTFGQAMLFSAACCIPAILSLVAFFYQIKDFDWKNDKDKITDLRTDTEKKGRYDNGGAHETSRYSSLQFRNTSNTCYWGNKFLECTGEMAIRTYRHCWYVLLFLLSSSQKANIPQANGPLL